MIGIVMWVIGELASIEYINLFDADYYNDTLLSIDMCGTMVGSLHCQQVYCRYLYHYYDFCVIHVEIDGLSLSFHEQNE